MFVLGGDGRELQVGEPAVDDDHIRAAAMSGCK